MHSQGEGGSDVGALIGALTGLISTLFGVSSVGYIAHPFLTYFFLLPCSLAVWTSIH